MDFKDFTSKTVEDSLKLLESSENGLDKKEAEKRLQIVGFNEIKTKEIGLMDVFWRQFKSPFFYLLFIASLVSFLIGEFIDGFLILIFVLINVFLGFVQEAKAEKAIQLLKKYIPAKTRVLRQGREEKIEKKLLAPGDIVFLAAGDIAAADLRVIKSENCVADESVLSGESAPVSKNSDCIKGGVKDVVAADNIIFAGTAVVSGEAEGVVISTANKTVFGEIAKLTGGIARESIYEKKLFNLSRLILEIVVVTIVLIFLANLLIKGTENLLDFSIFCIALIVSILPEALPLVVTFSLSKGALKLAKEKVVVKRLSAVEDLGNIEILCSDKTGTLTENKLTLSGVYSADADKEKMLLYGLLNSAYLKEEIESEFNMFDTAIFDAAPPVVRQKIDDFCAVCEIPFDLIRLRNSALVEKKEKGGGKILITKGAPEAVLKVCSDFGENQSLQNILHKIAEEGRNGKRVIGLAYKEFNKSVFSEKDEKNLTWLGYFSFEDPLKETAKDAVMLAKKMGLKIKIITGDSKEVAGYVAKEVGLVNNPENVISGETLESLSENDFTKACEDFSVFARVSPQVKYHIVESLRKKFEVGFLGEGINDAPALKASHVAIAVDGAADVSREVADIILLQKDLKVIIDGIKNGRNIFANINKYIKCTLASNFGNFYSIAFISLIIPFLPMLPIQILLANLLSDFPLIAVSSDTVDVRELRRPKLYDVNNMILLVMFLALTSSVFDFIFFGFFHNAAPALLQTLWFIESMLTELALIFIIRTSGFFLKAKAPSFALAALVVGATLLTIILPFTVFGQQEFHFIAPPLSALLLVFGLVGCYFIMSEMIKLIYFRYYWKAGNHY